MKSILKFAIAAAAITFPTAVRCETAIDYSTGSGYSSNIFEAPDALSGPFWQASLKLRGAFSLESGKITYSLSQAKKRTGSYRFGDTQETGINLGLQYQIRDDLLLDLEASGERSKSGDLFLALPQLVIGYRTDDRSLGVGGKITTTGLGGKTTFSARYSRLERGPARFTIDLIQPTKLDPDIGLMTLSAGHTVAVGKGEFCFCFEYGRTVVSRDEQLKFETFPAALLRGSLAYARTFENGLTLFGEAGLSTLASRELANGRRLNRPYLRAEAKWQLLDSLEIGATYKAEMQIAGIDDAIAERAKTRRVSASYLFHPSARMTLAYDTTHSEYVYYIYDRTRRNLTAALQVGNEKSPKFEVGYTRGLQVETEPTANFRVNTIYARLSGSL